MTQVPPEVRNALVIDDNDVRLSTGIEDIEDIIQDLKQTPGK
jgi:cystathionine beta-lyase/cystathionine gamma-synthase